LFKPRKAAINIEVKLPRSEEIDKQIEENGMDALSYSKWGVIGSRSKKMILQSTARS
jgi:hypothetical protein